MTKPANDWTVSADPTLSEIRTFLSRAEREAVGEFKLTVGSLEAKPTFWIMHHFQPTPYAFKDTNMVSQGTIQFCIQELGRYVSAFEKPQTQEQLAATLGLPAGPYNRSFELTGIETLKDASAIYSANAGPDMEPAFREGWQGRIDKITANPYYVMGIADKAHAWDQGWLAAQRHVSA